MRRFYFDVEVRSAEDIETVGACKWMEHPSAKLLCAAGVLANGPEILSSWIWSGGFEAPDHPLRETAADSTIMFVAHNAFFERWVWKTFFVKQWGYPDIPRERWICTLAKAWAHGLPGGLGAACEALDLPQKKNADGKALINLLCKAQKRKVCATHGYLKPRQRKCCDGVYNELFFWEPQDKPQEYQNLYTYCYDDVLAMMGLDRRLRDLTPTEHRVWCIDQRMNDEGLLLDMPLVHKIRDFVSRYKLIEVTRFNELTGIDRPTKRKAFKEWLAERGYDIPNTQGPVLKALKNRGIPDDINAAIDVFLTANKSSLAKYDAMVDLATKEGLIREILAYHAAHTGRWGGRGLQVQNLPRPSCNADIALDLLNGTYDTMRWYYEG